MSLISIDVPSTFSKCEVCQRSGFGPDPTLAKEAAKATTAVALTITGFFMSLVPRIFLALTASPAGRHRFFARYFAVTILVQFADGDGRITDLFRRQNAIAVGVDCCQDRIHANEVHLAARSAAPALRAAPAAGTSRFRRSGLRRRDLADFVRRQEAIVVLIGAIEDSPETLGQLCFRKLTITVSIKRHQRLDHLFRHVGASVAFPFPTAFPAATFTTASTTHRRTGFVGGDAAVAILVELGQRCRSRADLRVIQDTIAVRVQRGETQARKSSAARTAAAPS